MLKLEFSRIHFNNILESFFCTNFMFWMPSVIWCFDVHIEIVFWHLFFLLLLLFAWYSLEIMTRLVQWWMGVLTKPVPSKGTQGSKKIYVCFLFLFWNKYCKHFTRVAASFNGSNYLCFLIQFSSNFCALYSKSFKSPQSM